MQRVGFLALALMFSASSAFGLGGLNGILLGNGLQLGNGNGTSLVVQSVTLSDGTLLSVEPAR